MALSHRARAHGRRPAARSTGRVTDETGGALPGVTVELRGARSSRSRPSPTAKAATSSPTWRRARTSCRCGSSTSRRSTIATSIVEAGTDRHQRRGDAPVAQRRSRRHRQAHVHQSRRRREPGRRPRRHRVSRPARAPSPRSSSTCGRSCGRAKCSRPCPASSSRSTAAREKPTSTSCAASTSITAATSR